MGYDSKCEDLARYFLQDTPDLEEQAPELAQAIQDAVEIWILEQNPT